MPHLDLDYDLLNYLIDRRFETGARLPTINELQAPEHLGISISKVREQLEVARVLGLVEVRSKTGMRLKDYSFTPAVRISLFYALARDPYMFEAFTALRNHVEIASQNPARPFRPGDGGHGSGGRADEYPVGRIGQGKAGGNGSLHRFTAAVGGDGFGNLERQPHEGGLIREAVSHVPRIHVRPGRGDE